MWRPLELMRRSAWLCWSEQEKIEEFRDGLKDEGKLHEEHLVVVEGAIDQVCTRPAAAETQAPQWLMAVGPTGACRCKTAS